MWAYLITASDIDLPRLLTGGGYYVLSIAGVLIVSYYAVRSFRSDLDKMALHTERIDSKIDAIQLTLSSIQTRAAADDQRAQDIQQRVLTIEDRVTYLERN